MEDNVPFPATSGRTIDSHLVATFRSQRIGGHDLDLPHQSDFVTSNVQPTSDLWRLDRQMRVHISNPRISHANPSLQIARQCARQ